MQLETPKDITVTAIIPCFREKDRILDVLKKFDEAVAHIILVDDACPEKTGSYAITNCKDRRLEVINNKSNLGVGGATLAGYERALQLDSDVIVKVDGDGQMDPRMISKLIRPIKDGQADYCKGNRFFSLDGISKMPIGRIIGNLVLSFASKMSTGYWKVFDPTNGFTAIHAEVARLLPRGSISGGFFFESDMLYHLNISRAVVVDIPMEASYGSEESSLKIPNILIPFAYNHMRNFFRRIFYTYFLRDFNIASLELLFGIILTAFGGAFGLIHWYDSYATGIPAATGVIIIATLPFLMGFYLLIGFVNFDVQNQPTTPLHINL